MVGVGLFDLEDQFAFYGAYHSNKVNVITHVICVWPLLFGGLIMLAYTSPLAPQLAFMAALPFHEYMALNYCFVACAVYAFFYVTLEYKSGSLGALLVIFCWLGANAVAMHYPYTVGWKVRHMTSSPINVSLHCSYLETRPVYFRKSMSDPRCMH